MTTQVKEENKSRGKEKHRRDLNKVYQIGHATADAETKTTSTGKKVTRFTIAVGNGTETPNFFRVAGWEKISGVCERIKKGSRVLVEGSLSSSSYEVEGEKRTYTEIVANYVDYPKPSAN